MPKKPETSNKGGGKITRREVSRRVAGLGLSPAGGGTIGVCCRFCILKLLIAPFALVAQPI